MSIESLLSYTKPWLLIDALADVCADESIVTRKLITSSDYYLRGHFPAYSIYPGLLLTEGVKQSAELLLRLSGAGRGGALRVRHAAGRFFKPVEPGETVTYTVEREEFPGGGFAFRAVVRTGTAEAARIHLILEAEDEA